VKLCVFIHLPLLREGLKEWVGFWNTHKIQGTHGLTPDRAYTTPHEFKGKECKVKVTEGQITEAEEVFNRTGSIGQITAFLTQHEIEQSAYYTSLACTTLQVEHITIHNCCQVFEQAVHVINSLISSYPL